MELRRRGSVWTAVVWIGAAVAVGVVLAPILGSRPCCGRAPNCRSSLKQVGTAFFMYAQDYDGRLPPLVDRAGSRWIDLLYPYVQNPWVFRCTADGTPPAGVPTSVSYGYNWLALAPKGTGIELARAIAPAERVLAVETGEYRAVPAPLAASGLGSGPLYRHQGQAPVVYLDGHVKPLSPGPLERSTALTGSSSISDFPLWAAPLKPKPLSRHHP